ncbi:DUF5776 domain-containing protein [Nicoliella lavandulae]|uniref:DUF5776 domain-containing protein n=1 Tax=Nicoliella lavandulae TaxID=3082954 RepID=A0ABU8SLV1_9LACO
MSIAIAMLSNAANATNSVVSGMNNTTSASSNPTSNPSSNSQPSASVNPTPSSNATNNGTTPSTSGSTSINNSASLYVPSSSSNSTTTTSTTNGGTTANSATSNGTTGTTNAGPTTNGSSVNGNATNSNSANASSSATMSSSANSGLSSSTTVNYYSDAIRDAKRDSVNASFANNSIYKGAYNGFVQGLNGDSMASVASDNAEYVKNYQSAYAQGRASYMNYYSEGASEAAEQSMATTSLRDKPKGYINGYVNKFNAKLTKRPIYIYNHKPVYVYSQATFDKRGKIIKRDQRPQNKIHEFEVKRIKLAKSGLVRYYVKSHQSDRHIVGYLTTNPKFIANAYYQKANLKHNTDRKIRVINDKGIWTHGSKSFDTKHRFYRVGAKLKVKRVVRYKGVTRFYIGAGKYITSNKKFVKFL